jgi:NAD(P)H-dependent flavin oxidoreductase YrpB (nitropropane dioxygenase family)
LPPSKLFEISERKG